eukprot:TRINITY_DN52_c0_g1_i2.p1 TRINITY_DN52_c0_g1~~TRINITY_DN52_c0_g1_i2.p1  ORF type:complete len:193 (+),score=74.34 TRINITY_DN52_c0_g1_i2:590-1168(+)
MRTMNTLLEKCTQGQSNPLAECTKARDTAVNLLNDLNSVLFQYQQAQSLQQHMRSPQFPPRSGASAPTSPVVNRRRTSSSTPFPQSSAVNSSQSESDQKRPKLASNVKQEVSRSSSFPPSRAASPLNNQGMFSPIKIEREVIPEFIKREISSNGLNSNSNTPSNSPPSSPHHSPSYTSPSMRSKRTLSDLLN